ncbi:3-methyl-2-oxobutanoate hydroxymethyltransferase [candidate division KSB1 bacterium]|nr:3-methyl-2-oxobutanoate hydroxymethyltransferase [candidate division KSB1 bacterium]
MSDLHKVTLQEIRQKKDASQKITMLTAYDYPSASIVDEAGIDVILVGDSVAMTVLGYTSTVAVTMDEMLHHCKAVSKAVHRAFLIGDMPFMSFQVSPEKAVENAGRFIKEASMDAVKLEGGKEVAASIKAIINAGIPVMGHLGLTPQTATKLSGFKAQGKTAEEARKLLNNALLLQQLGCFAIVLEAVPARVAEAITSKLTIPTIGIGSGGGCDGQVLVYHDILGLFDQFVPKFVKKYMDLRPMILDAIKDYGSDVVNLRFPEEKHTYHIEEDEWRKFLEAFGDEER